MGLDAWITGEAGSIGEHVGSISDLPGSKNGPQDALRHITRAALLYHEDPDWADRILNVRETVGAVLNGHLPHSNSGMDYYNNALGARIAEIAGPDATKEEIISLAAEVVQRSLQHYTPNDISDWSPATNGDGYVIPPVPYVILSTGQAVPPIAVYPPAQWLLPNGEDRDMLNNGHSWPYPNGSWHEQLMHQVRSDLQSSAEINTIVAGQSFDVDSVDISAGSLTPATSPQLQAVNQSVSIV